MAAWPRRSRYQLAQFVPERPHTVRPHVDNHVDFVVGPVCSATGTGPPVCRRHAAT